MTLSLYVLYLCLLTLRSIDFEYQDGRAYAGRCWRSTVYMIEDGDAVDGAQRSNPKAGLAEYYELSSVNVTNLVRTNNHSLLVRDAN